MYASHFFLGAVSSCGAPPLLFFCNASVLLIGANLMKNAILVSQFTEQVLAINLNLTLMKMIP